MISSAGIGSGLDVSGIVSQLMGVERLNLSRLQADQGSVNAKISAMGEIENLLGTFQTAAEDLNGIDELNFYKANFNVQLCTLTKYNFFL